MVQRLAAIPPYSEGFRYSSVSGNKLTWTLFWLHLFRGGKRSDVILKKTAIISFHSFPSLPSIIYFDFRSSHNVARSVSAILHTAIPRQLQFYQRRISSSPVFMVLRQCFSNFPNPCPLLKNIKISLPLLNLPFQIILFEVSKLIKYCDWKIKATINL